MKNDKYREKLLKRMLSLIRKNPGIRASEINRKLKLEHSWNMRSMLIKKKLVIKRKDKAVVRYYPA